MPRVLRRRSLWRRATTGAAAMLTLCVLAGCGSGAVGSPSGPAVFATHCEKCHSLSGHAAPQQQGGDLKNVHLSRRDLLQYAAEMPVLHSPLTPRELDAVVSYVESVERRSAGG